MRPTECLHGRSLVLEMSTWRVVQTIVGHADRVGPEIGSDGGRPAMRGMDEVAAAQVLKGANLALCASILMMGVDSRKSKRLVVCPTIFCPGLASKDAIVAMIVLDGDAMGFTVYLIGFLGFQTLFCGLCLQ